MREEEEALGLEGGDGAVEGDDEDAVVRLSGMDWTMPRIAWSWKTVASSALQEFLLSTTRAATISACEGVPGGRLKGRSCTSLSVEMKSAMSCSFSSIMPRAVTRPLSATLYVLANSCRMASYASFRLRAEPRSRTEGSSKYVEFPVVQERLLPMKASKFSKGATGVSPEATAAASAPAGPWPCLRSLSWPLSSLQKSVRMRRW